MKKFEKYDKDGDISFAIGMFATFELLARKPECVECVLVHSKLNMENKDTQKLLALCQKFGIDVQQNDKGIVRLSKKENVFVVGVFKKYSPQPLGNKIIVLDKPSDMGNLGTIMRTALGFGIKDIVVVGPCVDVFNPKVIRASMGAIFGQNIVEVDNLEEFLATCAHQKFLFMLNGNKNLGSFPTPADNFALVFGNEARGLDKILADKFESVIIRHSQEIDSLNLPISVGMAIYEFSKNI